MRTFSLALLFLLLSACNRAPQSVVSPTLSSSPIAQVSPTVDPIQLPTPTATLSDPAAPAPNPTNTPDNSPTQSAQPVSPAATQPSPTPTAADDSATPPASATAEPQKAETASGDCTDIASFYGDVTIPDGTSFSQGETFVKTWRVRNEGTCAWDSSYSLVFTGGEVMDASFSSPFPQTNPGETADLSLEMTAPPRGGSYISSWLFENPSGKRFGVGSEKQGAIWLDITVTWFIPPGQSDSGTTPAAAGCSALRDTAYEAQVLAFINSARVSQGLATLEVNNLLTAAALAHSTDMACNNFVNHTGSGGSLWYDRVAAQGYANSNSARENIYVGNPQFGGTPDGAYNMWWGSQVHRDNILNPDVYQIGIGYVFNADSEYGGYYTTVFARP